MKPRLSCFFFYIWTYAPPLFSTWICGVEIKRLLTDSFRQLVPHTCVSAVLAETSNKDIYVQAWAWLKTRVDITVMNIVSQLEYNRSRDRFNRLEQYLFLAFLFLAFSRLAVWCRIFMSRIFSVPAFSCPVTWSVNFMSCNFMSGIFSQPLSCTYFNLLKNHYCSLQDI